MKIPFINKFPKLYIKFELRTKEEQDKLDRIAKDDNCPDYIGGKRGMCISEDDKYYVFEIRDYSTKMVGRRNEEGDFYIQRGDGFIHIYESHRIYDSRELVLNRPSDKLKITKFDWLKFKTYVTTYDQESGGKPIHINNTEIEASIIFSDMLYGLGLSIEPEKYKFGEGYKEFKQYLKTLL